MEAKEKAEKLYWKFVKIIDPHFGVAIRKDVKQRAIQCAMTCVGEFITDSSYDGRLESAQYWISVHQELEKMK
ncbi:hypothetical protein HZP67_09875 [Elizabethkingia anophelis]|nr:hypothetical protein [Elizabethkingia anophelis]MCT4148149.1 hypothetical protein [Elizabethkingia anophelis]MCT4330942.1 hypothetical protein [Elizabethkingia anophelis]